MGIAIIPPFQKLQPIAEWICHIKPFRPWQQTVILHRNILRHYPFPQRRQVLNMKRRMRFFGRNKRAVHAHMQLLPAALKPDAPPFAQILRFCNLRHTKQIAKEYSCSRLAVSWRRQLHMIDPETNMD